MRHAALAGTLVPTPQMHKLCGKLVASAATLTRPPLGPPAGGTTLAMAVIGGSFSLPRGKFVCADKDAVAAAVVAPNGSYSGSPNGSYSGYSDHAHPVSHVHHPGCHRASVASWFDVLAGVMRRSLGSRGVKVVARNAALGGGHPDQARKHARRCPRATRHGCPGAVLSRPARTQLLCL